MSFMIHNGIVPMIRKNRHQEKNERDCAYAYSLVCTFYLVTGIIGSMGLYNRNKAEDAYVRNDAQV